MRKNPSHIHNYLILTPTEERTLRFLGSQKHGASISEISRAINLARTSIYSAVNLLVKKKVLVRKGFAYELVDKQWQSYEQKITGPKKQIETLMHEMLQLKEGEIIYSIESDEEIKELFKSRTDFLSWQKVVAEKGIVIKGIGTKNALAFFRSMLDDNLSKTIKKRSGSSRLTDDAIAGPCTLVSFKNSTIFFSRGKNFFYRIDDSNVARFSQSIIDLLYNTMEYQPIV